MAHVAHESPKVAEDYSGSKSFAETIRPDSQNDEDGDQQQNGQDDAENEKVRKNFILFQIEGGSTNFLLYFCSRVRIRKYCTYLYKNIF